MDYGELISPVIIVDGDPVPQVLYENVDGRQVDGPAPGDMDTDPALVVCRIRTGAGVWASIEANPDYFVTFRAPQPVVNGEEQDMVFT